MFFNGVLVDSLSGQPIAGVTVSVVTATDPQPVAQTGADGQFNFNGNESVQHLLFSKIGYYPVTKPAGDIATLPASVIELEPGSAETLETVTVQPKLKYLLGVAAIGFIGYHIFKK